ncbi:hypothetical protein [Roseomonas xinghualingensis]|uniref:hypothetical protein n=1 Tax=Roseomonas xinghualingensis TaxID=2986475 RepID=UPI0021F1021F|nr:hypothetical protein [Roseomonas sp. SXEYE001]MCV4209974.1 hypothetical protein [Roseomonas sp. SXEYE001]
MTNPTALGRRSAEMDMAEHGRRLLMEMTVSDRAHAQAGRPIPQETRDEIEGRRARLQQIVKGMEG